MGRPRVHNSPSVWEVLDTQVHFGLPKALGTRYLVESMHLESKSINSGHAAHPVELGQLGSKVGVQRHVVEILIRHFWLVSVLESQRSVVRDAVCFPQGGWKPEPHHTPVSGI